MLSHAIKELESISIMDKAHWGVVYWLLALP